MGHRGITRSGSSGSCALLRQANEGIEMTRWIVCMAHDRKLLAPSQFFFSAVQLNECGRMVAASNHKRLPSPMSFLEKVITARFFPFPACQSAFFW